MRILSDIAFPFRSPAGVILAHVTLVPMRDAESEISGPLIEREETEALEHGESSIQLRESERYEYEVTPLANQDLRLRCSLSKRRRIFRRRDKVSDAGLIETRSFCGTLLLELVEGDAEDLSKSVAASALVDVRSIKVDYRTEYRGMLRRLSNELAGLVADARASTKVGFRSNFTEQEPGWTQLQMELLRETLESTDFSAALQRILSFPHEKLSVTSDAIATDRPIRWTPSAVKQLLSGHPRRAVPPGHSLRTKVGLASIAERVLVPRKARNLDTPENRFVKFALEEFRAFLAHAQGVFESKQHVKQWGASAALARRLTATLDDWLGRSLFSEIGEMRFAPLGSPVLQRKPGYREVLRWWLRFHTAAELSWEGGEDLFRAGQRNVADLYEYWLFFELLGWFCKTCRGSERPPIDELIEGLDEGSPNLRLRKRMELGPFVGTFAGQSRRLQARFSYNREFKVSQHRYEGGSWTRKMHPDYTLTFWPEGLDEADAERQELLVHVHFDAKYRVENIEELFGAGDVDDADEEVEGNYKRQDLLKMHAYRDAIKRSQGAYVLYPGRGKNQPPFTGFHEILPGLGAFGVAPDETGEAQGLTELEEFLNKVLAHLGNRTTAQDRVSFHIAESYHIEEEPVTYGDLILPEKDEISDSLRSLPPSEHHVLVAWYDSPEQLEWTRAKGIANVRLGNRPGTWHVPPEMASARHVLLRTHGGKVADGLFRLKSKGPGYKVFTAKDLRKKGYPGTAEGEIYAVFEVEPDPVYAGRRWNGAVITAQIKAFESRRNYRQIKTLHRRSPDPRVLNLRDLLMALTQ